MLVARRQGTRPCTTELPPSRVTSEVALVTEASSSGSGGEEEEDGGSEGEGAGSNDAALPRAVKHKAVEQRRKRKISEGIQQLLNTLKPPSFSGKLVSHN